MSLTVKTCRKHHILNLRKWALDIVGSEQANSMSDEQVQGLFSDKGYTTMCVYNGSYVFPEDLLVIKMSDVNDLVSEGKARWLNG